MHTMSVCMSSQGDTSMNSLKLTLLLSLAPFALSAGNCCDRTEVIAEEQCANYAPDFVTLKAEDVCNAVNAYVTILNEAMSVESWEFLKDLTKSVFGEAVEQTDNRIKFVFERNDLSVEEWFAVVAEIEAKSVIITEIIEANPSCTGGVMLISLTK